jgi:hypothetical protein
MEDGFQLIHIGRWEGVTQDLLAADGLFGMVPLFACLAAFFAAAKVKRQPFGDLLKPGPQGFNLSPTLGLQRKGEEHGLDGILGLVLVLGDPKADIKDHARIPAHDLLERSLMTVLNKLGK